MAPWLTPLVRPLFLTAIPTARRDGRAAQLADPENIPAGVNFAGQDLRDCRVDDVAPATETDTRAFRVERHGVIGRQRTVGIDQSGLRDRFFARRDSFCPVRGCC